MDPVALGYPNVSNLRPVSLPWSHDCKWEYTFYKSGFSMVLLILITLKTLVELGPKVCTTPRLFMGSTPGPLQVDRLLARPAPDPLPRCHGHSARRKAAAAADAMQGAAGARGEAPGIQS